MSSGHDHHGSSGQGHQVIDRLLKNPEVVRLLYRANEINRDFDLPYLGGYSKDGETIYIDRHLPEKLTIEEDGKKKEFDPAHFIATHERFEKAVMDALGWQYSAAHEAATGYERRQVLGAGLFWKPYQASVERFVKADEHEALQKVPTDLDMAPYYASPVDRGLISRMEKAMGGKNPAKCSKDDVKYTAEGRPASHCGPVNEWPKGACANFQGPHSCIKVRGYISPRGWCGLWESLGSK